MLLNHDISIECWCYISQLTIIHVCVEKITFIIFTLNIQYCRFKMVWVKKNYIGQYYYVMTHFKRHKNRCRRCSCYTWLAGWSWLPFWVFVTKETNHISMCLLSFPKCQFFFNPLGINNLNVTLWTIFKHTFAYIVRKKAKNKERNNAQQSPIPIVHRPTTE
jgi:hypothetical protein